MTAEPGTRVLKADPDAIAGGGALPRRRRAGRLPDRDRLRARRRRRQRRGGGAALRRQGPPRVQSADRARGGRRAPRGARPVRRRRREARRRVLAGAADAGAAASGRTAPLPISRSPGSTAWRCACRRIRSRGRCSRLSAARWWRHRRTAPAMSRRPAPRMCWPICAAASIWSSTAAPARSAWSPPSSPASSEPTLLRPGGVPREEIERVLGARAGNGSAVADDAPLAPGMLASHYAPKAQLRLDADGAARRRSAARLRRRRQPAPARRSICRRAAI